MVKYLSASAGDVGLIPGSGRSPGGGNGNPLQYSSWENPMDRGAQWATVHECLKESDTTEQLSTRLRRASAASLQQESEQWLQNGSLGFGWTPGVGDGQGGLVWCGSWGCKELDMTERLN